MRRALILSVLALAACDRSPPPGPAQLECERVVLANFGISRRPGPATVYEGTVAFRGQRQAGVPVHAWVRCVMDGSRVESVVIDGKLAPLP